jgi:NAD(P)-dependent dehydrogenase (short-subunit alcohol dehydrogenase family)
VSGSGELAGRKVLVVGAGTRASSDPDAPIGNGRAISVLAGRAGATVACADVDAAAGAATAALVEAEGAKAHVLTADVTDAEACAELVGAADDAMGGLDGLVLNVGIGAGMGMGGTTAEQWDSVFAVNVRSHFLLAAAALPRMPEGGSIVFISSIAGLTPGSRIPAYDSSKSALTGLCRQVAAEGARRGVRANVVAPGLIDTPLGRLASGDRPSRTKAPVPLGRQGTAWEVAEPVVFLLSDRAAYITSQLLAVDGGLTGCRG